MHLKKDALGLLQTLFSIISLNYIIYITFDKTTQINETIYIYIYIYIYATGIVSDSCTNYLPGVRYCIHSLFQSPVC